MSNKKKITYKCPYCDKRFNKENLVIHVGDKHDDMIPEGYSAFRVVFDYINKKPAGYNGKCIICGSESGWDENKGKYNRLCSNPECKKKYVQEFEKRMVKSKGVTRISSTAEGQAKMLANRKISGKYKFQDGGIKTYTGTYEKKALEFMDKVMNIKSEDVATPGPIMEYKFQGKTHIYISDIYYAPYNLIIEVKDGGDNPNNRSMPEYRAKQIEKEKYIIKETDYNYLRLTNNDFSQLLAVFMELKMEMSNDTPERVIKINENYIDNSSNIVLEAINNKEYNPIYLISMSYKSPLEKPIELVTGSKYAHSSLVINGDFSNMYSFNGDSSKAMNKKFLGGFSSEPLSMFKQINPNGIMSVSVIFVRNIDFGKLLAKLNKYKSEAGNTHYNLFGLMNVPINKETITNDNKMFCSQFVDYMLKNLDINITNKMSGLVTPKDIALIKNNRVYNIYTGCIKDFDEKKYINLTKKIAKKSSTGYIKEEVNVTEDFTLYYEEYIEEGFSKINKEEIYKNANIIRENVEKFIKDKGYDKYILVIYKDRLMIRTGLFYKNIYMIDLMRFKKDKWLKDNSNGNDSIYRSAGTHEKADKYFDNIKDEVLKLIKTMPEFKIFENKLVFSTSPNASHGYDSSNYDLAIRKSNIIKESYIEEKSVSSNITLYHGSHNNIKNYIEPRNNSYEDSDYVFATDDRLFALCYSGNIWYDDIINQSYYNGKLMITEMKPGALDKVFNTDGYIYTIDSSDNRKFTQRGFSEYIAAEKIKYSNKEYIKNVLKELESSGVEIYRYPNKPSWMNKAWLDRKNNRSIQEVYRSEIQSEFLEKGDSCYNLDKYPNQYNILFVTGISGSGKTTLGIDLAKEFNAERVELDYIAVYYLKKCKERNAYEKFRGLLKKECPEAVEFFDLNPVEKYGLRETWGDTGDILKDFCNWFINRFANNGKSYIINGSYLYETFDANFFYDKPLIIKDINLMKTVFRRTWREFTDHKDDKFFKRLESGYKALKTGLSKQYRDANKSFKSYKKDMDNNAELVESYIEERSIRGDVTLYHGSVDGTYKIIENNSINNGKRFEKSRTSSFWFIKKEYAEMFATAELVQTLPNRNKDEIFILIDNDMKTLVDERYKSAVIDWISKNECYVYSKLMNGKYITGGQGRNFPEYTLEIPVKPDNVSKVSFESKLNSIKFVSRPYIDSVIEKYKKNKMTYGNSLSGQMIDNILYNSYQDIIQNKRDIKRFNEDYIEESVEDLNFKSDKELFEWMRKNIKYSDFKKLKSHDEVLKTKSGSCHDQVMFEYEELKKLGYSPRGLFIIENNKGQGGTTHSLVYYKKGNKICWFENAWGGQEGISEYNSLNDIKNIIKDSKWGNINGHLIFKSFSISSHKPGESLQQFVDKCLGDSIKKSYIEEGFLKSEPDIYYNKEAFDKGDINICFVTGHSGSGKTTFALSKANDNVDMYSLDDIFWAKNRFTMTDLKNYGDLIYNFFNGPGKKYYITFEEYKSEYKNWWYYPEELCSDFIAYSIDWAKKHKNKKYIIEGIYLFTPKIDQNNKIIGPLFEPSYFKDYAFYIKGTSMVKSRIRAAKRDSEDAGNKLQQFGTSIQNLARFKIWKAYMLDEKCIDIFRNYFRNKPETILSESYIEESKGDISYDNTFNNVKKIADSLSKKELSNICNNEKFTDSPYTIYQEVLLVNKNPAAFVAAYSIPEEMNKDEAAMVVACNPKYRGNGYIYNLVSRAIPNIKELNIRYLYWETDKSNKASSSIAKKFGFKPAKNFSKDDDNYVLDLNTYIQEAYSEELGKIQKDPEIIDYYGFISSDGIYNENVKIKGFNKWLRGRSELLIIDKDKVYLKKDPKKGYSIPGGGWEKDEDHNLSAIRETNEEARIKVKNVSYVCSYASFFDPKDWVKEKISEENWWYGEYIELYIGEYDGQYKGKVDKIDQDKAMESGKFYDIKSVCKDLILVHQEALSSIVNESMSWKESDNKIKSVEKIYYGLTEEESKKKSLVYRGKNKGVNATLEGLVKFLKDNNMQDTITKYVVLDIDQFDIDYDIKYDEKYDMFCIKTPFEFDIKDPKNINYSISESVLVEAQNNILSTSQIKSILKKISDKVKSDSKPPTGNQNCMLCTWCLEAQLRGYDILPRPVYSPRDIIFKQVPYNIIKNPEKLKIRNKNDVTKQVLNSGMGSRYYVHVNWKGSVGGHEFIIMNINNKVYVLDAQQNELSDINISVNGLSYFNDINYANSYIIRLDNKELNKDILKYNDNKYIIYWDDIKDPEYMQSDEYNSIEESVLVEAQNNKKYYHVSQSNLDGKTLQPSIPNNYFTKNGYEDDKTKRVCFTNSIDNCLRALSQKCTDMELYVHILDGNYNVYKPSVNEVPDSEITGEVWVTKPCKVKCIGKIKVTGDRGEDGLPFKYGDKTAELYDWDWEWIEQLSESKDASTTEDDFKKKSGKSFKLIDLNTKAALKYVSDKWQTAYRNTRFGRIAVCKEDDKLAGYIYWNKSGTIGPLEVYKEYRGYGLSEILMKEAIKNGGNKLGVYSDNEVAIKLYKKLGFVETGRKKYKDGDEVIIMELKSSLNESKNKSTLDDNFEKKKIDFKYYKLDINDSDAKKYLETNSFCKKYLNYISKNTGEILVDEDNDKLIGYIWVGKSKDKGLVTALDILNNYKGYGLSEILIEDAINKYGAVHLTVDPDNEIAIHLYEKFGFVIVNYYDDNSGKYYYMRLESKLNNKQKEDAKKFKLHNVSEASISDYKFLDIKSNKSKALEYLKANSETEKYAEDTIKNYNGELVIYNDTMIGRILVGDKKDKGFITDLSVDEEHRGNKLGSKLIDDAINKYHGVDLMVDKDNELALNMYKRRGFVIVKTYKNQYYMKLKSKLKEDTDMISEAMNALMTGYIPGSVDNPNNTYIVNYMQNNVFSDEDPNEDCIGVSDNIKLTNLIIRDKDGILKKVDESFLKDKDYKVYVVEKSVKEIEEHIAPYMDKEVEFGFLYELVTGKKLYTKDQVGLEGVLVPTIDYYEYMKEYREICDNFFMAKDKKPVPVNESTFIPKEVRHFSKSGLMLSDKVYTLNEYLNSKPKKILECLDITIKEG